MRSDGCCRAAEDHGIDGDWYESVKTWLERIEPHLPVGGVFVIDEYFADKQDRFAFEPRARLHIVRVR